MEVQVDMQVNQAIVTAVAQSKKAKKVGKVVANVKGVSAYQTKGGVRFLAQVRLAGRPAQSKSFDTREEALAWKREQEASKEVNLVPQAMTVGQVIQYYIEKREALGRPLSRELNYKNLRVQRHPLMGGLPVQKLNLATMRAYCEARKFADKVDPATISGEYIVVKVALGNVASWLGWGKFDPLDGASASLLKDGLIADGHKRERRPSAVEMDRLREYFRSHEYAANAHDIPMADIVAFASLNAFRRGEITQLKWSEYAGTSIVCWRKDGSQVGGKRKCIVPLMPAAAAIIERQPRIEGEDRIFPFADAALTLRFSTACDALGINTEEMHRNDKLRFHDLRHEAISTMSSVLGVTEAMLVSGHKTTKHFLRYVNLAEEAARIAEKMAAISVKTAANESREVRAA